ncbi:uncharacterized protein [Dysidea avara]|uniref:uncharacterized protein n=1 Tax=Dysidea avara TaxID=196820 RepID=UPI00332483D3
MDDKTAGEVKVDLDSDSGVGHSNEGSSTLLAKHNGEHVKFFYKKVCLLRTIVRLQLSLKSYIPKNNDDEDTATFDPSLRNMSYHYYPLGDDEDNEGYNGGGRTLLSDSCLKQMFLVKRNKTSNLPTWFVKLTETPPHKRTDSDIHKMRLHLEKKPGGNFLSKFNGTQRDTFCRKCRHTWYEKGRVIIRAGHKGEFVYFVYNGSASVTIEYIVDDVANATMKPGTIFGELSLLYDIPRSATVVCESNVDVLYVDKEVTKQLFPDKLQDDMNTKLSAIRRSEMFSSWLTDNLINLCIMSRIQSHNLGHCIHDNSIKSQFLYLVTKGRVEMVYEVVNLRISHSAKHHSELQYLPKLKHPNPTLINGSWSKIRPQSGLVSIDFVTPYSLVHPQCLFDDRNHVEYGLRIVSKGAEVMRIPKLHIRSLATQSCWKAMMQKSIEAKRYPSITTLQRTYVERIQWLQYRSAIYCDVIDEKYGCPLASKPASAKGTSGWSKFPGIQTNKRKEKTKEPFSDCLGSSVPVHLHRSDTHGGWCLKRLPARWTPKRVPTLLRI